MGMIKQSDPRANYLAHREDIDEAVARVLASGWYLVGKELEQFEDRFADFCDATYAVGVANGTDAIELALRATGVKDGDFVLTTALTAVASATGIVRAGASPIFVDIDADTCNISPVALLETIEHCHRSGTMPKAILLVHLYGQPATPNEVLEIANRFGFNMIEDCAQAHDARVADRKVSTFGEVAAFSFYPTKNLGTLGDAGAVVTSNHEIYHRVCEMRQYGWDKDRTSNRYGLNSRMDELHAAVLSVKLNHLEAATTRRTEIAKRYDEAFAKNRAFRKLLTRNENQHVYHQYVLRADDRGGLQKCLLEEDVATAIHYSLPVHKHPFFAQYRAFALDLSEAERASREVLSLPMYPELDDTDVERVIAACRKF